MDLLTLQNMTTQGLNGLFIDAPAGEIPDGPMDGFPLFGSWLLSRAAAPLVYRYIWRGKTFDAQRRVLFNRFPTTEAFSGALSIGPSLYDQAACIVVAYTHSPTPHVRDELRQVAPGLYLGKAYQDQRSLIHFALTGAV